MGLDPTSSSAKNCFCCTNANKPGDCSFFLDGLELLQKVFLGILLLHTPGGIGISQNRKYVLEPLEPKLSVSNGCLGETIILSFLMFLNHPTQNNDVLNKDMSSSVYPKLYFCFCLNAKWQSLDKNKCHNFLVDGWTTHLKNMLVKFYHLPSSGWK